MQVENNARSMIETAKSLGFSNTELATYLHCSRETVIRTRTGSGNGRNSGTTLLPRLKELMRQLDIEVIEPKAVARNTQSDKRQITYEWQQVRQNTSNPTTTRTANMNDIRDNISNIGIYGIGSIFVCTRCNRQQEATTLEKCIICHASYTCILDRSYRSSGH